MDRWRPEKWIKTEDYNSPTMPHQGSQDYDINGKPIFDKEEFEKGADAMLKSLELWFSIHNCSEWTAIKTGNPIHESLFIFQIPVVDWNKVFYGDVKK